jgi:hypothetical protein
MFFLYFLHDWNIHLWLYKKKILYVSGMSEGIEIQILYF